MKEVSIRVEFIDSVTRRGRKEAKDAAFAYLTQGHLVSLVNAVSTDDVFIVRAYQEVKEK